MKRITLVVFICLLAIRGYAQPRTFIGIYGGGGLALTNNYDVAISGGLDFTRGIQNRLNWGFKLFYQQFGLGYDNEAYGAKDGVGNAGAILNNKSSFVFIAPKLDVGIRRMQNVHFYVDAGVGFKMSGTETLVKWDHSNGANYGNYDSVVNTTPNITSMLIRVGAGLVEYLYTSKHWRFTFTEDFGFIPQNLSSTASYDNPSRTAYTPRSLAPEVFSIQIGLTHIHFPE